MSAVDWAPALLVLAAGLALGGLLVLRLRRKGTERTRALGFRRDALLSRLRKLSPGEEHARERYALELEAARVLLALEERDSSPR